MPRGTPVRRTLSTLLLLISLSIGISHSSIADARTIIVGVYPNFPLNYMETGGRANGFLIELLEYIAKKEGWRVAYVPASWSEHLESLKAGKIDLLGGIIYSEERDKWVDFTYESVLTEWAQIYVNKKQVVDTLFDLEGKKVAVLRDDAHFLNLRHLMNQFGIHCRYIEAFEYGDVLSLTELGKCDVGLVSNFFGIQHEHQYDIDKTSIVLSPQKLFWAIPQDQDSTILDRIDFHLRALKNDEDSIYYQYIGKWFGMGPTSFMAPWIRWVIIGFVGLLTLSGIIILISRVQVKSRTRALFEKNRELSVEIEHRKAAEADRAALEAKLRRAQKMEALGTLAGGVAHDLNNILSGLVSYPELLLLELPEESPLRTPIMTIKRSGEKAAHIVQDLLTLARRGVEITQVVNLNRIIQDYLSSPEHAKLKAYHPLVAVKTQLSPDLMNIMGSPVHLSKTIMNLVSNAAEAMPEGGRLTIVTQNRYVDAPVAGYDDILEGDYALVTVSDEGVGISREDLERIFEPFYTKKVMGRSGTGLGMAVVWGTVKDHLGYIDIQSTEGFGSSFSLYFPVTRKALSEESRTLEWSEIIGSGERILVVDDVQEQREIASRMLTRLGYKTEAVSSGEEAIEYVRENDVDLLVLDMIMDPGIDGLDTYRRVLDIKPGQKAIIASGFSETDRIRKAQDLGAGEYVKKPYTLEKIGSAIKKALTASRGD